MRYMGKDTGGRQVEYIKGQYLAQIGYSKDEKIGETTFSVAIWFSKE